MKETLIVSRKSGGERSIPWDKWFVGEDGSVYDIGFSDKLKLIDPDTILRKEAVAAPEEF